MCSDHDPITAHLHLYSRIFHLRHIAACGSAFFAGFSAFLAVVCTMLRTFIGAVDAGFGTKAAELAGAAAFHRQQRSRSFAKLCAFHVELDTVRHHCYFIFFQTRCSTAVTHLRALKACIDAAFIILVIHNVTILVVSKEETKNLFQLNVTNYKSLQIYKWDVHCDEDCLY